MVAAVFVLWWPLSRYAAAAMSGDPEALLVVNQLRDLAADPMNRRAIVQDPGCLPGLILFLDHANPQVVYSALLVRKRQLTLIYYICMVMGDEIIILDLGDVFLVLKAALQ